ncbi:uncharacterized protein BDW47DRAFT_110335 [Aspergillus candidus]|uniref:Uncharacterized protein n=1 Tax=Aspergillus candidus TaxID=41067 RepID=A0A2I2F457_ASPCN|nr:hypothetical protein BDW47DRAFT_110335 [Aspergillus candidus]PLB35433.1 hypothetical protein BDW47DRAFT_110335 [Aspergillus candidus]
MPCWPRIKALTASPIIGSLVSVEIIVDPDHRWSHGRPLPYGVHSTPFAVTGGCNLTLTMIIVLRSMPSIQHRI